MNFPVIFEMKIQYAIYDMQKYEMYNIHITVRFLGMMVITLASFGSNINAWPLIWVCVEFKKLSCRMSLNCLRHMSPIRSAHIRNALCHVIFISGHVATRPIACRL